MRRSHFLLTGLSLLAAPFVHAQPSRPAAPARHVVHGFRSARFGMGLAQVRAAAESDFPDRIGGVEHVNNPAEQTTVLVVRLPRLEPGPGPASVSYVLGARSKRLMAVNVVWQSGAVPAPGERNAFAAGGTILANYFRGLNWGPMAGTPAVPAGPNGLVMFVGADAAGATVDVRVLGVEIVAPGGKAGPEAKGPVQLRVGYHANPAAPDVVVTG
ncbi:MAG TPA: hypothetical protein VIL30_02860 [Ramlibacter sp.]